MRYLNLPLRALLLCGVTGFAVLAAFSRGAGPFSWDVAAVSLLRDLFPGRTPVLAGLEKAVWMLLPAPAVLALLLRQWSAALFPLLCMLAVIAGDAVKAVLARPRPPVSTMLLLGEGPAPAMGASFPSGTGVMGLMLAGTTLYLLILWHRQAPSELRRRLLVATAVFWGLLNVGALLSVAYVGRHWLSDMIGGYFWGAVCLSAVLALHRWWRHRTGALDAPAPAHALRLYGLAAVVGGLMALVIPPFMNVAMCIDWGGRYTAGCGGLLVSVFSSAIVDWMPRGWYQRFGMIYFSIYLLMLFGALALPHLATFTQRRAVWGHRLLVTGLAMNLFGNVGDYWLGQKILGQPWWGLSFAFGTMLGLLVYMAGALLAGSSLLRSETFPRWAAWVLMVGPVAGIPFAGLINNMPSGPVTMSGLTWLLLGLWMAVAGGRRPSVSPVPM